MNELLVCFAGFGIVCAFIWLTTPETSRYYKWLTRGFWFVVTLLGAGIVERLIHIHLTYGMS
ncbi:hypothetical protein SmaMPs15_000049 [Stenotrophomonas maltophilia phage vB_SmaM_Ps15]|uniref:Uncharacterized protein n=1 Tax=Stenotrophomonas maltophilia phage vB_SmaM_Ps15 TaxID=3071007 RepID=A0AAE9FRE4_9CAUD|nr:hypothetical protein PQC01_gp049 [Stenotrophomonas maltophilia phage vB_SmaM_Ps15]UMO77200.1 hypothetical protein SmaMPs15_000049 [Stenotrophomonas maltophilia phage vB_SmaM_Ps15]